MSEFIFNHINAAFRICVDQTQNGRISGLAVSQRLSCPMPFHDIGDLVLQIEDILDIQNFPQAFQRSRSFQARELHSPFVALDTEKCTNAEVVAQAKGTIATFDIFVITRCHSSWQGQINWLDGTDPQEFSSDLDLIRITDEHIFG